MNTYKLTYIPYFVTNEISYDDMRSDSSMKSYVIMPGVVYSDRVIVQSENIKNYILENLFSFTEKKQDNNGIINCVHWNILINIIVRGDKMLLDNVVKQMSQEEIVNLANELTDAVEKINLICYVKRVS